MGFDGPVKVGEGEAVLHYDGPELSDEGVERLILATAALAIWCHPYDGTIRVMPDEVTKARLEQLVQIVTKASQWQRTQVVMAYYTHIEAIHKGAKVMEQVERSCKWSPARED